MNQIAFDFGVPTAARDPRPRRRTDDGTNSAQVAVRTAHPRRRADDEQSAQTIVQSPAPRLPHFAVLDLDRDTWRMYDTATGEIVELTQAQVLAADFPHTLTIVEACHLRPQSATSVAHPFVADELNELAANLTARNKRIRTVNNRRTPRIWSEAGIGWDDRPKDRDTAMWAQWLLRDLRRLESCKHWPEAHERRSPERDKIMRDVNIARQYRQNHTSVYAQAFATQVRRRLWRAYESNAIPHGTYDFRHYVRVVFGLGAQRKGWPILDNPYICDAYCVAVDIGSQQPRQLSNRQIRHICGFSANGYPNQIRSDLHHHLAYRSKLSCTEIQRGFVKVVRALIDVEGQA